MENILKLLNLSKSRIKEFIDTKNTWYKGYQTYIEGIENEFQEVKEEIKENNSVYLEDELGDLFWDYICLLNSLEQEGKISLDKVFERSYKKFSQRITAVRENTNLQDNVWSRVKQKQKEELEKEHKILHG